MYLRMACLDEPDFSFNFLKASAIISMNVALLAELDEPEAAFGLTTFLTFGAAGAGAATGADTCSDIFSDSFQFSKSKIN